MNSSNDRWPYIVQKNRAILEGDDSTVLPEHFTIMTNDKIGLPSHEGSGG